MADIAKFIEDIKALSVLELNELVKAIEEEFGVSAAVSGTHGGLSGHLADDAGRWHRSRAEHRLFHLVDCLGAVPVVGHNIKIAGIQK